MAENDNKRYYWLKLKKDFFQQHQIKILKSRPNGRLYALIYLELLAESTSHEGELRYSDTIPYDLEMLASVIDEDVDNIRCAIDMLRKLELVEIEDDRTIYMREIEKLIGSESHSAERMRKFRENKKIVDVSHCDNLSQNCHLEYRDKSIENREKRESKRESEKTNKSNFVAPSLEEVKSYCRERNNNVNASNFINFYESKGWMVGKNKMKDWKAAVRTWEQREDNNKKAIKKVIDRPIGYYSDIANDNLDLKDT